MAFFKAVVNGYPVPEVSWGRNKGDLSNPTKYVSRYDEMNKEYILEVKLNFQLCEVPCNQLFHFYSTCLNCTITTHRYW